MNPTSAPAQIIRVIDVIRKKRDGGELSRYEIDSLVNAYTAGDIPDYQVSAWLMAVVLRGMTRAETAETVVVVADDINERDMHEAGRVARLHPGTSVVVLASEGAGMSDTIQSRPHAPPRCRRVRLVIEHGHS